MAEPREASGRAHARAALVGNPSDGYGGRTLAVLVRDFAAEATARRAGDPEPPSLDLIRASVARFDAHCRATEAGPAVACSVEVRTDIPRQVGLAGSSGIVIATLRALAALNGIELEPHPLVELALAVETEELGIPAGRQDRVVQAYEGLVCMDFGPEAQRPYEPLDPGLLPPLFLAYGEPSGSSAGVHAEIRRRFEQGEADVVEAMRELAELTRRGRECLLAGDRTGLGEAMDASVDARARIVELEPAHLRMVEIARNHGAHANYAGSGGAIVGIVPESGPDALRAALTAEGIESVLPRVG